MLYRLQELPILLKQQIKFGPLDLWVPVGGFNVDDGFPIGLHWSGLVRGGKKAVREVLQASRRHGAAMQQNVARQILVFTPKCIVDPGPKAWKATRIATSVHEQISARVQRKAGDHRADDRDVIDTAG